MGALSGFTCNEDLRSSLPLAMEIRNIAKKEETCDERSALAFAPSLALLLCLTASEFAAGVQRQKNAQVGGNVLPDGFYITPTAAPGSIFQGLPTGLGPDGSANANGAVTTALSEPRQVGGAAATTADPD